MDDIAEAAGVTRQTVYAHYSSRDVLLGAVIDQATREVIGTLDAAELDQGPAPEALLRFLEASWRSFERFPLLLGQHAVPTTPQADLDRHEPVLDRLHRLVRRGQDAGDFDRELSPSWLLAATVALGHTAGTQAAAGELTTEEASRALKRSVLRLYGVPTVDGP